MRVSRRNFIQAGSLAAVGASISRAEDLSSLRIFVDSAPFPSVDDAAEAEERVDWRGSDIRAMNACTLSYAATELRRHIRLLTGEELSIAAPGKGNSPGIYILAMDDASIPTRARAVIAGEKLNERLTVSGNFALVPHRRSLYLIGNDRAGALYAVYHFLELQGIRWYEPGEENTYVLKATKLNMPSSTVVESPKMFSRGFIEPGQVTRDFHVWMARNRLNLWENERSREPGLKKLCLLLMTGGHGAFPRYINPQAEYPYAYPLFPADRGKPPDPYKVVASSYLGDANHDGKLSYWEAHPEWYGMENGARHAFRSVEGLNPCLSNDDMLAEVFKGIVHELSAGEWQHVDMVNFWCLDSRRWCQCGPCQALGSVTDQVLHTIHKLRKALVEARERGELQRNVKVLFAMYLETLKPPTRPLPADFDYENCIGTMFPISRCYGHLINDPKCTEYNTPLWSEMTNWRSRFENGQLIIGEYYNVSRDKSLPALDTHTMIHDIPAYYALGARNMHYMHVSYPHNGPKRWRDFLFAKLLWNPETSADTAHTWFREYLRNFYGETAAAPMEQFYDHLEIALSAITSWRGFDLSLVELLRHNENPEALEHLKIRETHPPQNDGVDLEESVAHLARCRKVLDELLHQSMSEPFAGRLREDDMHVRYAENTAGFYYRVAQSAQAKRRGDLLAARTYWRQAKFYADRLTQETLIVNTSAANTCAKNAFVATELAKYFPQLGEELQVG